MRTMMKLVLCLSLAFGASSAYCENNEAEYSAAHVKTEFLKAKVRVMRLFSGYMVGLAFALADIPIGAVAAALWAAVGPDAIASILGDDVNTPIDHQLTKKYNIYKVFASLSALSAGAAFWWTAPNPNAGSALLALSVSLYMISNASGESLTDALVVEVIRKLGLAVVPQEAGA